MSVGPAEEPRALLLRDASGHGHGWAPACLSSEHVDLAQAGIELVLGVLANATGVDHDQVGVGITGGRLVAGLLQQSGHALGVVDVHLAAVCAHLIRAGSQSLRQSRHGH